MGEVQIVDRGPNSYRSKEGNQVPHTQNEERLQPVIKGEAKLRKKSAFRKFKDAMITEDAQTIKHYILTNVLVPAVKTLITNSVNAVLYPNGGGPTYGGAQNVVRTSGIAYNKIASPTASAQIGYVDKTATLDFGIPTYTSFEDADYVLAKMKEIIAESGSVSFLQLYDLSKIPEIPFNCDRFGWRDLRFAKIEQYGGQWTLRLPKALPL